MRVPPATHKTLCSNIRLNRDVQTFDKHEEGKRQSDADLHLSNNTCSRQLACLHTYFRNVGTRRTFSKHRLAMPFLLIYETVSIIRKCVAYRFYINKVFFLIHFGVIYSFKNTNLKIGQWGFKEHKQINKTSQDVITSLFVTTNFMLCLGVWLGEGLQCCFFLNS